MKPRTTWIVSGLLVLVMLGIAVWAWPQLPDRAPVHWNAAGQVDGWMPRFWAAALWPLLLSGLALLFAALPAVSPRRFAIRPFARAYDVIVLAVLGFLVVVGATSLSAAARYPVSVSMVVPIAVGVLLLVIGNFMGKFRKNFFIGIRTPWTLASAAVWERTHRLAGWLFVLAGLVCIVGALVEAPPGLMLGAVIAATAIPAVWSGFLYRRLERHPGGGA